MKNSWALLVCLLITSCVSSQTAKVLSTALVVDSQALEGQASALHEKYDKALDESEELVDEILLLLINAEKNRRLQDGLTSITSARLTEYQALFALRGALEQKLEQTFDTPVNLEVAKLEGQKMAAETRSKNTSIPELERADARMEAASKNAQYLRLIAIAQQRRQQIHNNFFEKLQAAVSESEQTASDARKALKLVFDDAKSQSILKQIKTSTFPDLSLLRGNLKSASNTYKKNLAMNVKNVNALNLHVQRASPFEIAILAAIDTLGVKLKSITADMPVIGGLVGDVVSTATSGASLVVDGFEKSTNDRLKKFESNLADGMKAKVNEVLDTVKEDQ